MFCQRFLELYWFHVIVKDGESKLKIPLYEIYEARTRITWPVQSVNIVTDKKTVKALNNTTKRH